MRGRLRVHLGAAPGSGTTFAMLTEGRERAAQGEDVVVGLVETHGRPRTVEALGSLEVVPPGAAGEAMDLDAVLARRPQVVLVDDLAHANLPDARHARRWQEVEALRDAGIDVVTTVDVCHIESVAGLAEQITGLPIRDTVPDEVVDGADEVQFVDIAPEALRRRLQHGNVVAREKVDGALRGVFQSGTLAALREMALRLVAERVATERVPRRSSQDVLVVVHEAAGPERLIRRAVRIARRFGGRCWVLVEARAAAADVDVAERCRALTGQLRCSLVERPEGDPHRAVAVARELAVRHVVVGAQLEPPLLHRWRRSLVDRLLDELPGTDVHVIAPTTGRRPGTAAQAEAARRGSPPGAGRHRRRGRLRVHLGYAHGVGTTTAMLAEGRRRRDRGTDVVVAALDTPSGGRREQVLAGLELLGGAEGAAVHGRLDLDALLSRNPEVACIDDLAGLDVGGRSRAEVVLRILDAGITVIATLHLTDLASMAGTVARLVGDPDGSGPRVDDSLLADVDDLELVDVTPSVLDERLRRGRVVPPSEAGRALQGEFRPQVLAALRETAFRVVAEHANRQLLGDTVDHRIDRPWGTRPRVMACVPPRPHLEDLIRRAARLAAAIDGELRVVSVRTRRRSDAEKERLGRYASLTHQLGGEFITLHHRSAARALAAYARQTAATEVLLTRGREHRRWTRHTLRALVRSLSDVDVHILAGEHEAQMVAAARLNAQQAGGHRSPAQTSARADR
jgi:two-component system, OmpR family, sensor histidine kinase KdpD